MNKMQSSARRPRPSHARSATPAAGAALRAQEYWAAEDEKRREAARQRTEAAMAKRREAKAAQEIKLAALGIHIPSAEEVCARAPSSWHCWSPWGGRGGLRRGWGALSPVTGFNSPTHPLTPTTTTTHTHTHTTTGAP